MHVWFTHQGRKRTGHVFIVDSDASVPTPKQMSLCGTVWGDQLLAGHGHPRARCANCAKAVEEAETFQVPSEPQRSKHVVLTRSKVVECRFSNDEHAMLVTCAKDAHETMSETMRRVVRQEFAKRFPKEEDCRCGFKSGDRVKKKTDLISVDGAALGHLHGRVEDWKRGCHLVRWDGMSDATALPDPNVTKE